MGHPSCLSCLSSCCSRPPFATSRCRWQRMGAACLTTCTLCKKTHVKSSSLWSVLAWRNRCVPASRHATFASPLSFVGMLCRSCLAALACRVGAKSFEEIIPNNKNHADLSRWVSFSRKSKQHPRAQVMCWTPHTSELGHESQTSQCALRMTTSLRTQ
jgi:hypothetical protein